MVCGGALPPLHHRAILTQQRTSGDPTETAPHYRRSAGTCLLLPFPPNPVPQTPHHVTTGGSTQLGYHLHVRPMCGCRVIHPTVP